MEIGHIKTPLISAIIPIAGFPNGTHQIEKWIKDPALREFEIILVVDTDDFITHEQTEIIAVELKKLTAVTILQSLSRNPGGSRNLGLSIAKGSWVVFWDCDDVPSPSSFLKMVYCAEAANTSVAVGGFTVLTAVSKIESECKGVNSSNIIESIAVSPGLWRFAFQYNLAKSTNFPNLRMAEDQIYLAHILLNAPEITLFNMKVYEYWSYVSGQLTKSSQVMGDLDIALDRFVVQFKQHKVPFLLTFILKLTFTAIRRSRFQIKLKALARLVSLLVKNPIAISYATKSLNVIWSEK
jgi:glycosyltransferase involved in cell wall biosynthesis